jgi:N-acetyl-alpha-D-muramate 1-phosphate uridylyltransferase
MKPVPDTAMVMAAGKGTRMMPLTADRPKPLVKVAGMTLLDHVLDQLRSAGIDRIVVNVHYLPDQIEAHLAAHAADFEVVISDERGLLLDTGGGLIKALPQIGADPFYCVNADNWWVDEGSNALADMAQAWDADRMDVLMLVVPYAQAGNTQGDGDFDMDADGRLSRDGEKRHRPFVWTGIQMMAQAVICDPPSEAFSTNVFWDRAIAKGRCFGLVHAGQWYDVGYPAAIGLTEAALAGG